MSGFSLTKFFAFLLVVLFFVHAVEAQEKTTKKTNVLKKIISKVDGKKGDAPKDESAKAAATETKPTPKGRLPVIIIPGLIGSELVNKNSNEKVWFDLARSKDDDLRLPISPDIAANRDNLVPGDVLRKVQIIRLTPEIEIYQKLIDSLAADGYKESKIDAPDENGYADTVYLFPYDWRLDNVENAHILLQKMDALRAKLKRPDLKFNIVAHSMGGLIARYAAMYGKADLTARNFRPTWKGASYINSILLVATPNGGSLSALNSLLNGFSLFGGGKVNLPFLQNLSKYDLFTIPSIYQLLPHDRMVRAFDENLKPLKIDIYNPVTWEKYGWTAYTDEVFSKKIENATQGQAKAYFQAVLLRAKLFQAALGAKPTTKNPIPIYYFGSECRPTVDGMIIHKNSKDNTWKTEFETDSFTKSDGTKVSKEELGKVLYSPGDGVVPKRSLISSLLNIGKSANLESDVLKDLTVACGEHNRLVGDEIIDKTVLNLLNLPIKPPPGKAVKLIKSKRRTN
jgi:pimeloyl-ACP methyl ester carboxylesterase